MQLPQAAQMAWTCRAAGRGPGRSGGVGGWQPGGASTAELGLQRKTSKIRLLSRIQNEKEKQARSAAVQDVRSAHGQLGPRPQWEWEEAQWVAKPAGQARRAAPWHGHGPVALEWTPCCVGRGMQASRPGPRTPHLLLGTDPQRQRECLQARRAAEAGFECKSTSKSSAAAPAPRRRPTAAARAPAGRTRGRGRPTAG